MGSRKRIVVFASGGGSNFTQIQKAVEADKINADIVLLISNNPKAGAVKYASDHGIAVKIINGKRFPDPISYQDAFHEFIYPHEPDLLLLAGFMKLIPDSVVSKYNRKILNIHPALLPMFGGKGFYGMNVHRAVHAAGVKISGPTVHFVNEEYDAGPIIAQQAVPITVDDTPESIAAKVLVQEHKLYPEVVSAFCEDRIVWINNNAYIKD